MPEDVIPASSPGVPATGTADGGVTPEGDEALPFHSHPRWQEVYGSLKEYKDFGSVEELNEKLRRLDYYDRLIAEQERQPEQAPPTAEQQAIAEKRQQAYKELQAIAPELAAVKPVADSINMFYTALEHRAMSETKKVMADAGMGTSAKDLEAMAEVLSGIIKSDKDLYYEYVGDPRGAVRESFSRFTKQFGEAADRKAKAALLKAKQPLQNLPKTHTGGTPPGSSPPGPPRNLKEAKASVLAKLEAMG